MTTGDSASLGERVSRLEGVSEHFATKEDIARLEAKIDAMEMRLLIRLGGLIVVAVGIVVAIEKFWS
jgi:hypothetical protein